MNQDEGSKVQRFEKANFRTFPVVEMKIIFSDEDAPSLTPYSCCKKSSVCYGNTNRDKSQIWVELPPSINMTLINEQGCLKIFSDRLDEICVIIFIVVGIVFLLQILILIGMVILMYKKTVRTKQTSNHQSQTDLPRGVKAKFFFFGFCTNFNFCENFNLLSNISSNISTWKNIYCFR